MKEKKPASDYIIIGKVGSSHGIRGWFKVQTYTEIPSHIFQYQPWYLSRDQQQWELCELAESKTQADTLLAKLKNIHSPEAARLLTGSYIGIKREQLPALTKDEYYWSDLINLTVINQRGETLGKVSRLLETGANDVLIVKGDHEHAIPFLLGRVITQIDLVAQIIYVDWELL